MDKFLSLADFDEAVNEILKRISHKPEIGLILGSGLGEIAELVNKADIIPFNEIPNFPRSTVEGHKGQLVIGELEKKQVMILQGRVHYYEGYSMDRITIPVRIMQRMGMEKLIVTNAAGAINPKFVPGDVMLITDHIAMIGMAGLNPLRGPNIDEIGPRFPDMSQVYNRELMSTARMVASQVKINLREGVYVCLAGPSFESPADLRFLKTIGADAVGMSTVPEAIVARHGGMAVLGLSGISNKANLDGNTITTHEEVLEAGKVIAPKLSRIILEVLNKI